MGIMSLSPEEIAANFDKFRSLCERLADRSTAALALVDHFAERLALCPASGRKEYHLAEPGGLVDHSLRVLGNAMKLCKAFEYNLPKDSLIIACLFHDIGKLGDLEQEYYLPQDSDWHRDKLGEMYKHNKDIKYMTVPHRGVWLCQHFGLKLTQDEWLAIMLNDGWVLQENKAYCLKEGTLVSVVQTADYLATKHEKETLGG
jgi:hypothetical protein